MSETPEFDPDEDSFDPAFYGRGENSLTEAERDALGDITGFDILVTPEGTLEEALSLANLGANVTLLGRLTDDSRIAIEQTGVSLNLVGGRLEEGATLLESRTFDIVYSPWGSLDGLASFEPWAARVSECLKPGGHLFVFDEHPVSFLVGARDGELVVQSAYWGEFEDLDNDGVESEFDVPTGWALGDLVTALGTEGVATLRLEEVSDAGTYLTALSLLEGVDDERRSLLPCAFLLVARKL